MDHRRTLTALAALSLGWLVPTATAQGPGVEFDVPWLGYDTSFYPQGYVSWASEMADFDGDGVPDLAVSSWYSNSRLSVLIADGQGGFAPPVFYGLSLGGRDLTSADFDRDGDLDLVVSNTGQSWEGDSFSLFSNQGNGTFVDLGSFPCFMGPNGIVAADFDGDGWTDVAVAHEGYISYGASAAYCINDRSGGFLAPTLLPLSAGTHEIDAGDLDGDGDPDLVIAHETNRVSVLMNGGGFFFPPQVLSSLPSGSIVVSPAARIADVDRDGDLDLVYSHSDLGFPGGIGLVALYRNPGTGVFGAPESVPLLAGHGGAVELTLADWNGDGWPDLAAALGASQIWTLALGDGAGGFLPALEYRAGEDPQEVEAGDLNGDGLLDAVVLGRDSFEACVYLNPGGGAFVQPPVIDLSDPSRSPTSSSAFEAVDVDNDGDRDLVIGWSANFHGFYGIDVRRNNGNGTYSPPQTYSQPVFPIQMVLRDLDGDGFLDILYLEDGPGGRPGYRYNLGDGNFGPIHNAAPLGCSESLEAADVDGDGDLDLIAGCNGTVKVGKQQGGLFGPYQQHQIGGSSSALALDDLDRDGQLDLITNSGVQGYVEVSLGNGDGTFRTPTFYTAGRAVRAVTTADVSGDGIVDVVATFGLDGGGLSVLRGRGDGSFRPPLIYRGSTSATYDNIGSVELADVDGDGDLDAFCANFGSQDVSFWRANGDGTYQPQIRLGVGQQALDLELADFTGDGLIDLMVQVRPLANGAGWYYPGAVLLHGVDDSAPQTYCTAQVNSQGCRPAIGSTGTPSATAGSGFSITVTSLINRKSGILFYGLGGPNQVPFRGGTLCVLSPLKRTGLRDSGGNPPPDDCSGAAAMDFNAWIATGRDGALTPGARVWCQYWSRDPASNSFTNLSDALTFRIGN